MALGLVRGLPPAPVLIAASLSLMLAGCGEAESPEAVAQRTMVISNLGLTGEAVSPTQGPRNPSAAPSSRTTVRPTVGVISYETPTPIPTPGLEIADVLHDPRFNPPRPTSTAPPSYVPARVEPGAPFVPPTATPVPSLPQPPPTPAPTVLTTGQTLAFDLPAGTETCDTSQTMTVNYPGDNSRITIDVQLNGLNPGNAGDAGVNVWDSFHTSPVQTATTLTNQKNGVPGSIELSYAAGVPGRITIEVFNWARTRLTGSLTVVGLASNADPLRVVSEKAPGAC